MIVACKKDDDVDPDQIKADVLQETRAETYDFTLIFDDQFNTSEVYDGLPFPAGQDVILVYYKNDGGFLYSMPYIETNYTAVTDYWFSYHYSPGSSLVWITIDDLNNTDFGDITTPITRNFRAVLIKNVANLKVAKDWKKMSYPELKQILDL